MLTEQYLIESRYGALIMAFSAARMDMMGGWAAQGLRGNRPYGVHR